MNANLPLPIIQPPENRFDDGISRNPFAQYRVTKWSDHPSSNNYCCIGGDEFDDEEKALEAFDMDDTNYHVRYVVVDGPGMYLVRSNKFYNSHRIAQSGDGIGHEVWFKEGEELPPELAPHYP